jgi:hypothetical protein
VTVNVCLASTFDRNPGQWHERPTGRNEPYNGQYDDYTTVVVLYIMINSRADVFDARTFAGQWVWNDRPVNATRSYAVLRVNLY